MAQKKFRFKKEKIILVRGKPRPIFQDDRTLPRMFWPSRFTGSKQWCEN